MNIEHHWEIIRDTFKIALKKSHYCSFATVTEDGLPHVTPIGSLILRDNCTGYYFDEYSKQMPANLKNNQRVSILAVNSGFLFWLKSLYSGSFKTPPGIRLHGKVGDRRPATDKEIAAWQRRVKDARNTKGYQLIWKSLKHVRDIEFDAFEPITAGKMTKHLFETGI